MLELLGIYQNWRKISMQILSLVVFVSNQNRRADDCRGSRYRKQFLIPYRLPKAKFSRKSRANIYKFDGFNFKVLTNFEDYGFRI